MNAETLLHRIAKVLAEHRLKTLMIGNSAAALHGAPVTTLDIEFMFCKTPANSTKLKKVARSLNASILKPYYPVSDLYRVVNDENGMQLDFMSKLHGIRSFEGLKTRATSVDFGDHALLIASLAGIVKSKRAVGRNKDLAVLDILEQTQREQENNKEKQIAQVRLASSRKRPSSRGANPSAACAPHEQADALLARTASWWRIAPLIGASDITLKNSRFNYARTIRLQVQSGVADRPASIDENSGQVDPIILKARKSFLRERFLG